jgi:hypothetical protein
MEDVLIRLQCLAMAREVEYDGDVLDILETAEAFYDFVTENEAE